MSLAARRSMAEHLQSKFQISERRACQVLELSRSSKRRKRSRRWTRLTKRLVELSERYSRMGYRKIWRLLKKEEFMIARKRVRLDRKKDGPKTMQKQRETRAI